MASFQDDFAAAQDPRVQGQVTAAILNYAANTVLSEGAVTNHVNRAQFATRVVGGLVPLQPLILSAVVFGSLSASSAAPTSDTQASNSVAALWNLWAGGF